MFTVIVLLLILASLVPLAFHLNKCSSIYEQNKDIRRDNKYYRNQQKPELPYPKGFSAFIALPVVVILSVILFEVFSAYAVDFWWYEEVQRTDVFWTLLLPKLKIFFYTFVSIFGVFSVFSTWQYKSLLGKQNLWSLPISFVVALGFSLWIASEWTSILMYQNQAASGILDPLFNKDASYYMFTLPLYDELFLIAKSLIFVALVFTGVVFGVRAYEEDMDIEKIFTNLPKAVWVLIALWCSVHVFDRQLSIYQLMYDDHKLFAGINYVGQNVDIPIYHTEQIIFAILGVIALCIPFFRKSKVLFSFLAKATVVVMFGSVLAPIFMAEFNVIWLIAALIVLALLAVYFFLWERKLHTEIATMINIVITILVVQFLLNELIVPAAVQAVYVNPKEKQLEAPYIKNNIQFTKQAFCLTNEYLVEKTIPYVDTLTRETLVANKQTVSNIRVLDQGATLQILDNSQTETQYYHFNDVDVDRYPNADGSSTMYFAGAREMNQSGLQSKTYYNTKYVYGHGYGYIKARGNAYDISTGYPILEVKGMPIKQGEPRIYYQEGVVPEFFYVNTKQAEIDYPVEKGEVEYTYTGKGGVTLNTTWKKICFANEYDWRLFFTNTPVTEGSKIMINRNVVDRVTKACPFVTWDDDALFVIRPNGTTAWIVNGFTTSKHFPYASEYEYDGGGLVNKKLNYIRHSVKAVVDAFDGTIEFYVINDKNDPIISTIEKIFPHMFKPLAEMPKDLQAHLIYPEFYFKAQTEIYLKYHMDDPYEFYQQDKIWRIANENYKGDKVKMSPRYMLLRLPNEQKEKFVVTLPFTPKELNERQTRDYLTGWVAGECDPENFLRLNVYMYPKGEEIFGPWMIENATNTESQISKSFSLWGTGGSSVWQGNLMLVPVGNTIISAEPIIVLAQANDGRQQLPSIKMIVAFQNKHLAWGRTTEEALYNLLQGKKPQEAESFTGNVQSVYDEYTVTVTVPVMNAKGEVISQTLAAPSREQALKEMQKAIQKLEEGLSILKGAVKNL